MNNASCSMKVVYPFLSRYSFAVSHRSIGWGRKQIMDLRPSESHNDDGFGHRKSIKEYLFETQPMRQQFQWLCPFSAGILRPHGQRGAAERRLPQPELDRPEGQVQQHRIGQLAPGRFTWPLGCLPRYLSKDLSGLKTTSCCFKYYIHYRITKENNLL